MTNSVRDQYVKRADPPFCPIPASADHACDLPAKEDLYNEFKNRSRDYHALTVKGVFHVFPVSERDTAVEKALFSPLPVSTFYKDLSTLLTIAHDAACKSFTFKRLKLLEALFNLHVLLNAERESLEQKKVPHRDFYNIRKIDTHIHHSAIMNQKHLLRFIKHKLKHFGDEVVMKADDKFLTLNQVFESLQLTSYDLSIDTLDMHASNTFHRFDRFNLKYNPIGESRLREIFLKTDNLIAGRYLADVTEEVYDDLKMNKYVFLEPRISIYGRKLSEFENLAAWWYTHRLDSVHVRYLIQIPRLYSIYKKKEMINTFQDLLTNVFQPLFEVTINPEQNIVLHYFLRQVVGFDCVDDESKLNKDHRVVDLTVPPSEWDFPFDPPYSYWIYYIYANLQTLNHLRSKLGMNTFELRPHAGEAGDLDNLASTFLLADKINHGILLRKAPTLQYLYYLCQVGLALSPLSNNKLFLDYHSNPFPIFFARGLNVSLSTDDPLMLHFTKEPLVEEYSCAAQVWKLSSTDMSEIARNSVLQSGFEHPFKQHFIGKNYFGQSIDSTTLQPKTREGKFYRAYENDIDLTNVPDIRVAYRKVSQQNCLSLFFSLFSFRNA